MKQFGRIYFLIAMMACNLSLHVFAKDPAVKNSTIPAIETLKKTLNIIAPNKASKITLCIASAASLAFFVSLFKIYFDAKEKEKLQEEIENVNRAKDSAIFQIDKINSPHITSLDEKIKSKTKEFDAAVFSVKEQNGKIKAKDKLLRNFNRVQLTNEKDDTGKIKYTLKIPKSMQEGTLKKILVQLQGMVEEYNNLQDGEQMSEKSNKSKKLRRNRIRSVSPVNQKITSNKINEVSTKEELTQKIEEYKNVLNLFERQKREFDEELAKEKLKKQQEIDAISLLNISTMPGQKANINHPYFYAKNEAPKDSAHYTYEIIQTNKDRLLFYKAYTKDTEETTTQYENHLIILDSTTHQEIENKDKQELENICTEKMFSSIHYMNIKPGVVYTFFYYFNNHVGIPFEYISKHIPDNQKSFHTLSIIGEGITQFTLKRIPSEWLSKKTQLNIAGLGKPDRAWMQTEDAVQYLNQYQTIFNVITDQGSTQNRILKNEYLNNPIVNIAIQTIKKIDNNVQFERPEPQELRKTAFYAISGLYYGILYHTNITKKSWGKMNPNLSYVYEPNIKGALGLYCHSDNICTNGSLDETKFALFASYEFTKTDLYTRIVNDKVKLEGIYGKGFYPITRTEEMMNNTAETVKNGMNMISHISVDTVNSLYSYLTSPKDIMNTMNQYTNFRNEKKVIKEIKI